MELLLTSNNAHHSTVMLRGSLSTRQGQGMTPIEVDRCAASARGSGPSGGGGHVPRPG